MRPENPWDIKYWKLDRETLMCHQGARCCSDLIRQNNQEVFESGADAYEELLKKMNPADVIRLLEAI